MAEYPRDRLAPIIRPAEKSIAEGDLGDECSEICDVDTIFTGLHGRFSGIQK